MDVDILHAALVTLHLERDSIEDVIRAGVSER